MREPILLDSRDVALGTLYITADVMADSQPDAVALARFVEAVRDTARQGLQVLEDDYLRELLEVCRNHLQDGLAKRGQPDQPLM